MDPGTLMVNDRDLNGCRLGSMGIRSTSPSWDGFFFTGARLRIDRLFLYGIEKILDTTGAIFSAWTDHAKYYQNYWFLDVENEAYYAEGNFYRFIYIYPSTDLVLV